LEVIIRDVNASSRAAVSLLPIFRSEAQYRLLGELFTNAGREYSIGELAGLVDASQPTASREVDRLVEAGLLVARSDGRKRLVSAREDTPVFAPLRDLLGKTYGVPAVLAEEFGHLDARVMVFGSYAARWFGETGPTPRDIDVLVLGDLEPLDAWDAAARASSRLGMEVNVVVRAVDEWEQDTTGFARQVKRSPTIDLGIPRRFAPDADRGGP
jgi:DNA-binding transcriptional ArsR family regulator